MTNSGECEHREWPKILRYAFAPFIPKASAAALCVCPTLGSVFCGIKMIIYADSGLRKLAIQFGIVTI